MYAKNVNSVKKQLEIITFLADIGMEFGQKKCSYLTVEWRKSLSQTQNLSINALTIFLSHTNTKTWMKI